jgi:hypothetical protein
MGVGTFLEENLNTMQAPKLVLSFAKMHPELKNRFLRREVLLKKKVRRLDSLHVEGRTYPISNTDCAYPHGSIQGGNGSLHIPRRKIPAAPRAG